PVSSSLPPFPHEFPARFPPLPFHNGFHNSTRRDLPREGATTMPELTENAEGITRAPQSEKKASATRIFQINLRKFFPPNDEYATCMVRLCILREDLALEVKGITEGPFDWL